MQTSNTDLECIASYINNSNTGCIAEVKGDHVNVQVPGRGYINGKPNQPFFSTEIVRSMSAAIRLINSME